MLLAELEIFHTRPAVPTRRVALGHMVLPVEPAPGFGGLYAVVPQARIRELLETEDDRYRAVLSDLKGCANAGLLINTTARAAPEI